jgi:hypothetical protein
MSLSRRTKRQSALDHSKLIYTVRAGTPLVARVGTKGTTVGVADTTTVTIVNSVFLVPGGHTATGRARAKLVTRDQSHPRGQSTLPVVNICTDFQTLFLYTVVAVLVSSVLQVRVRMETTANVTTARRTPSQLIPVVPSASLVNMDTSAERVPNNVSLKLPSTGTAAACWKGLDDALLPTSLAQSRKHNGSGESIRSFAFNYFSN